jgi:hypothetical protein
MRDNRPLIIGKSYTIPSFAAKIAALFSSLSEGDVGKRVEQ